MDVTKLKDALQALKDNVDQLDAAVNCLTPAGNETSKAVEACGTCAEPEETDEPPKSAA